MDTRNSLNRADLKDCGDGHDWHEIHLNGGSYEKLEECIAPTLIRLLGS